jgi:valyl-tRNA synthetase
MPFITEEIWHLIMERKDDESIMIARMPEVKKFNRELLARFETVKETVTAIRSVRKEKGIPNREKIVLCIRSGKEGVDNEFIPVIMKLCNLSDVTLVNNKKEGAASFITGTTEYYIPLEGVQDNEAEISRIREDLNYYREFLASVMKKLDNVRFVQNAPGPVLELERKKKADTELKIQSLEERLKELDAQGSSFLTK